MINPQPEPHVNTTGEYLLWNLRLTPFGEFEIHDQEGPTDFDSSQEFPIFHHAR